MSDEPAAFTDTGTLATPRKSTGIDRILILEDNQHDQSLMIHKLNNLHVPIDVAENLETGYGLARANQPDVILLDIQIPIRNGSPYASIDEVLNFIRFHKNQHCVIMVTGVSELFSETQAFYEAGAMGYISKDKISIDLQFMERVKYAYHLHTLFKENIAAAQVVLKLAILESNQDIVILKLSQIIAQTGKVREAETELVKKQSFDSGKEAGKKELKKELDKKRLLKRAITTGGLAGIIYGTWQGFDGLYDLIEAFVKGWFKSRS
jgi:response regulator RpfG family c-di-GMP phosphodiesterase